MNFTAKFVETIGQFSGAVGNLVFAHNTYGAFAREKCPVTNPRSNRQSVQRCLLANASSYWKVLDPGTKTLWANFAVAHPVLAGPSGVTGGTTQLTGQAYFCLWCLNWYRSVAAQGLLPIVPDWTPPTGTYAGRAFGSIDLSLFSVPPFHLAISLATVTGADPNQLAMSEQALIYASAPQSLGLIGSAVRRLRYVCTTEPGANLGFYEIGQAYAERFGAVPALGQCLAVGARLYTFSDGGTPPLPIGFMSAMISKSELLHGPPV